MTVEELLVPVGSLWVTQGALWRAAAFVNDIPDSVIIGYRGPVRLTMRHRKAMRFDWGLSMIGTVLVAVLFGGLIFWMGTHAERGGGVLIAVSCFSFSCAALFILCGLSDYRVMNAQLDLDEKNGWVLSERVNVEA